MFDKKILSVAVLSATVGMVAPVCADGHVEKEVKPSVNSSNNEKMLNSTKIDPNFLDVLVEKGAVKVLGSKEMMVNINGEPRKITAVGIKSGDGNKVVAYKIGELLVVGGVFDKDGRNLAVMHKTDVIPVEDLTSLVGRIDKEAVVIEEGNRDAPVIYVFSEPVCPACKSFVEGIQPLIDQGKLRVKWVMVSFLSKQSPEKIQALLNAQDPVKALRENYKNLNGHEGGIKPADTMFPEVEKKIRAGLGLMKEAGIPGTPGIIVKKDGKWQLWDRSNFSDLLNSK